jgi:hypothetical protein
VKDRTPRSDRPPKHTFRSPRTRQVAAKRQSRPLWNQLCQGAAYAVGGGAITMLTTWVQHFL